MLITTSAITGSNLKYFSVYKIYYKGLWFFISVTSLLQCNNYCRFIPLRMLIIAKRRHLYRIMWNKFGVLHILQFTSLKNSIYMKPLLGPWYCKNKRVINVAACSSKIHTVEREVSVNVHTATIIPNRQYLILNQPQPISRTPTNFIRRARV